MLSKLLYTEYDKFWFNMKNQPKEIRDKHIPKCYDHLFYIKTTIANVLMRLFWLDTLGYQLASRKYRRWHVKEILTTNMLNRDPYYHIFKYQEHTYFAYKALTPSKLLRFALTIEYWIKWRFYYTFIRYLRIWCIGLIYDLEIKLRAM